MSIIDPFEPHPQSPSLKNTHKQNSVSIDQLTAIVNTLSDELIDKPDRAWGFSRVEVESWMRRIVDEAEKINNRKMPEPD